MKVTYDSILNSMKSKFCEISGRNVELMSDIGARFQAVASELYSLYCYGDYILRQAFPQTASSKELEYHAKLRDIERKTASKATGNLVFYLNEAAENDVEIPEGTICSAKSLPYIQFETTQSAAIKQGETSATVTAAAIGEGSEYNVHEGTVTVMVTPVSGVPYVKNTEPFSGGCDSESDRALRERILSSYSVDSTGVSAASLRQVILKLDEVLDCGFVTDDSAKLKVYVKTKDNTVSDDLKKQIENCLMIAEITSKEVSVSVAEPKKFSLYADIDSISYSDADVTQMLKENIQAYASSLKIGETLKLSALATVAAKCNVEYFEINSPESTGGCVICPSGAYLSLSEFTVNAYE